MSWVRPPPVTVYIRGDTQGYIQLYKKLLSNWYKVEAIPKRCPLLQDLDPDPEVQMPFKACKSSSLSKPKTPKPETPALACMIAAEPHKNLSRTHSRKIPQQKPTWRNSMNPDSKPHTCDAASQPNTLNSKSPPPHPET